MGLRRFLFTVIVLIIAVLPVLAQRDSIGLTTLVTKTEKFSAGYPFEKVYLHFDKPYYAVGDTIWFKAYITIGPLHQPSGLSHIVYVDVIRQDSVVKTLKLPTISGVAFGDIILPTKLFKQGNYHIRAYTNWMRNFGPDYFFNKTISIGDAYGNTITPIISLTKTQKNKSIEIHAKVLYKDKEGKAAADKTVNWTAQNDDETVSKGTATTDKNGFLNVNFDGGKFTSPDDANLVTEIELNSKNTLTSTFSLKPAFELADVQFFPEGGELIAGVRSKVAFKAVNTNGVGIDVTGSVIDNAGNEVSTFASQHAGMGIFALLPGADKTYKAIITFPDGAKNTYNLSNVQNEGIVIAVNNIEADSLSIRIATNDAFFKEYHNKGFYIVAQSGGTIYYTALAALQSLVYAGTVPKSKFPTGILQVTLFAANGEPLSERIVFIQHNDAMGLKLTTNLPSYSPRQLVKLNLSAKNKIGPVQGSFSVAVIDETKVPYNEDAETTILSSLLLTSDLRGYIEKPNYYFNQTDAQKLADLDVLMLTQGYRRFSYTNILEGKYPPLKFAPEKGMSISGTLRTEKGLPVFKGMINLQIPDRHISVNGVTDADGRFSFSNVSIFDSSKVVLIARTYERNNNLMIMTDAQTVQPVTKNYSDPDAMGNIDSTMDLYLQNSKKQLESSHVLKEVVIRSTKTEKVTHEPYSSLTGLSQMADQSVSAGQLKYCSFDIISCITSKVFGIWLANDNFYIKRDYDNGNRTPIQFFVNGLAVDFPYLTNMRTEDIGLIEIYLTDGVSGINDRYRANGIISITTKNGKFSADDKKDDLPPLTTEGSSVTLMPKGYYRARVFYSPKYNNQQSTENGIDLRSTLYWNPNVITDKNGNADFQFYNSDGRGPYRAVIEGIDNDGNIGRYVLRYNVR